MAEKIGPASGRELKLTWSEVALAERDAQLRYIEGENRTAALRIDAQIDRQADLLGDSPYLGRRGRESGTREMIINRSPFILIYRISRSTIEILRLLHGRQQWPERDEILDQDS